MALNWRVYGTDTVASVLDKSELPGFWRQVTVGPDEVALVVRNGELEKIITETSVGASGVIDKAAGLFGKSPDVQVTFVDTSPFKLAFFLEDSTHGSVAVQALSADRQQIPAKIDITCRVFEDDAELLVGLLHGRPALASWDIAAMIRDELLGKVLVPKIARYRADELRGNTDLREEITQSAEGALRPVCDLWGLTLENFSLTWGLTEQERNEIRQARGRREEEAYNFEHDRGIQEMQREVELKRTRLNNVQEIKVLEAKGEQELLEIYLTSETNRDQIHQENKLNTARIDAEISTLELDVKRREAEVEELKAQNEEKARVRESDPSTYESLSLNTEDKTTTNIGSQTNIGSISNKSGLPGKNLIYLVALILVAFVSLVLILR